MVQIRNVKEEILGKQISEIQGKTRQQLIEMIHKNHRYNILDDYVYAVHNHDQQLFGCNNHKQLDDQRDNWKKIKDGMTAANACKNEHAPVLIVFYIRG